MEIMGALYGVYINKKKIMEIMGALFMSIWIAK